MATIRKRGKTYQIRVSTGYDALYRQVVRTKTWKPKPGMSDKQIEAELNKQAVMFEELLHQRNRSIKYEVSGACREMV